MQRAHFPPFVAPALLALLSTTACGSDSSGGESDQGKLLSDLSAAEKQQLCTSNFDDFQALIVGSCTRNGLDAPTQSDCETARDECQQGATQTSAMAACSSPADYSQCTSVRVSQVESCLTDAKSYFSTLSCDNVGQEPPQAPGCLETIESGCPALLGGGGS